MSAVNVDLAAVMKRLNLATVARSLPAYETRAAKEGWSHRDFLAPLLAEEVAHRTNTRVNKLARYAHFPYLKTIEEFDFVFQSALRRQALGPYLGPEFVTEGRNLILSGKPGRGKTHLAIALAYRAIQNGFEARFVTASALIDELHAAARAGTLREATAAYVHPHVLVVDEVGYLQCADDAANVLYGVVDQRCRKRKPLIFTTNKPLKDWGAVLHDEELAEALLDRVLERGQHIKMGGPSCRASTHRGGARRVAPRLRRTAERRHAGLDGCRQADAPPEAQARLRHPLLPKPLGCPHPRRRQPRAPTRQTPGPSATTRTSRTSTSPGCSLGAPRAHTARPGC